MSEGPRMKVPGKGSVPQSTTSPMMYRQPPKIVCSRESFLEFESFINATVPFVDRIVDHDCLEASALEMLKAVFPTWRIPEGVEMVQCKDGITNKLLKCKNIETNETVLIRAYGKKSELIIDRPQEMVNFVTLSLQGLSPPLYARFKNGFVYGYIEGVPLTRKDMADEEKGRLIARNVAKWHRIEVPGEPSPRLFRTLRKWLAGVPKVYADAKINAQFQADIDMKFIAEQLGALEEKLGSLGSPVVFCHNDLLSANIIYKAHPEPDVAFIDFEYGANNYRGFDIANHFCEWAGFECCFEDYPSKTQQMVWLHEYLVTLKGGHEPTELELESLYLEVNLFALSSHFFWGLWALIQADVSDIKFDYMGYAIKRFDRFKATKDQWMAYSV